MRSSSPDAEGERQGPERRAEAASGWPADAGFTLTETLFSLTLFGVLVTVAVALWQLGFLATLRASAQVAAAAAVSHLDEGLQNALEASVSSTVTVAAPTSACQFVVGGTTFSGTAGPGFSATSPSGLVAFHLAAASTYMGRPLEDPVAVGGGLFDPALLSVQAPPDDNLGATTLYVGLPHDAATPEPFCWDAEAHVMRVSLTVLGQPRFDVVVGEPGEPGFVPTLARTLDRVFVLDVVCGQSGGGGGGGGGSGNCALRPSAGCAARPRGSLGENYCPGLLLQ